MCPLCLNRDSADDLSRIHGSGLTGTQLEHLATISNLKIRDVSLFLFFFTCFFVCVPLFVRRRGSFYAILEQNPKIDEDRQLRHYLSLFLSGDSAITKVANEQT